MQLLTKENIKKLPNAQCGIYKITNQLNNHCYIGISVDIKRRLLEHLKQKYDATLYDAFNEHGIENFVFQIIELCERKFLFEKEKYWVAFYDSYYNGYNMTPGGEGYHTNGRTKEVCQYDLEGNFIESYSSILEAERQLNINPKTSNITRVCQGKAYISNGYQWRYKENDIDYLSNIGKCPPQALNKNKQCAQCDLRTHVIIKIFNSIHEASNETHINRANIIQVCNGIRKNAGGFYWKKI